MAKKSNKTIDKKVEEPKNQVIKEELKKKFTDSDFLYKMIEESETDYYTFGAYSDFNGMDVKNIKNPIFDKKKIIK